MPRSLFPPSLRGRRALALAVVAALMLAAQPSSAAEITGLKPAKPEGIQPGLAVEYWFNLVHSVKEMEYSMGQRGRPGKPLPMLDYKSGVGNVLTANQFDGVLAHITGFIRFEQPGSYGIWLNSNDGSVLKIGEQVIIDDGQWHPQGDLMTGPVQATVAEPGWYPLDILYFERKGTSTLQLFWLPPGASGDRVLVPAEAFGHAGK